MAAKLFYTTHSMLFFKREYIARMVVKVAYQLASLSSPSCVVAMLRILEKIPILGLECILV
jgi:hypothetical protein